MGITTVQQIIDWVDRKYPNQETDANKIIDLNVLYKDVYNEMNTLSDNYINYETYTISGQVLYTIPSDCRIYNIKSIQISTVDKDDVDVSSSWDTFEYAAMLDEVDVGNFYGRVNENTIIILKDGLPIQTTDLVIKIYYFRTPAILTAVTDTLNLDDDYTNLLRFGLTQLIASQGANPDTEIADYYQNKYDETLDKYKKDLNSRFAVTPIKYTQVEEGW